VRVCRAILLAIMASTFALPAHAQDTGWTITRFDADYTVLPDRSLVVVETIAVDFKNLNRHGIYRDIPVQYKRVVGDRGVQAGRVTLDLNVQQVTDGRGAMRQTKVSREDNDIRIRIGDPDRTISGRQTYVIQYTLSGGLGFFDEHDELYWQVTGTRWPVKVERASATVMLPHAAARAFADAPGWSAYCYAGWAESTSNARCSAEYVGNGQYEYSSQRLDAGEGLTLVAGFPKGVIAPPTKAEQTAGWLIRWGPMLLPLFSIAFMFQLWQRRGREPDAGSVVATWQPPEGIRPGPAGTLVDQRADMDDVVATVLDLAVRGYVEIREVPPDGILRQVDANSFAGRALKTLGLSENDWQLTQTRVDTDELKPFERRVLTGIFEGEPTRRMSDLHNEFYTRLPRIHESLYADLVRERLFPTSPHRTRVKYRWIGGAIIAAGVAIGAALSHIVLLIGVVLSGLVVLLFSFAMPAMTPKGAQMRRQLKGLEEYIRRVEKAEMEFRHAPERTPELFEILLPFAVALDVSDIWVKQFEDVLTAAPAWYGSDLSSWNANSFGSQMAGFQSAATRTLGSAPGSSSGGGGGGSVGGGGGGGGGGSW
jgi:uncharacterized membrane protein YgcG